MDTKKSYYRLVFTNQAEYFVESSINSTEDFLKKLDGSFIKTNYIVLQKEEGDPINFRQDKLFYVQKAPTGIMSIQTKIWRLVE